MEYTIITKLRVFDTNRDWEDDSYRERLYNEQQEKCDILGLNGNVLCHFFDSPYFDEQTTDMDLDYAIQCLAIKDGVDMVQWDNGNYGFVAYYNGNINGFEVIG